MRRDKKDIRNYKSIEEDFVKRQGLPFEKALSEAELRESIEKIGLKSRNRVFTPIITIWAFLSQILGKSNCREATARVQAFWLGKDPEVNISTENSAYCEARKRIPEKLLKNLVIDVGEKSSKLAKPEHLWCGREVKVFDATAVTMADTEKNRAMYSMAPNQKEGCGFPIVQIAIMFSLATGAVLRAARSHFNVSESRLFYSLYQFLSPGDIVLGDRGCCSYAQACMVLAKQSDFVFRAPLGRKLKLQNVVNISKNDHCVTWTKPKRRSALLSKKEFDALPEKLLLREISYNVNKAGYRTKRVTVLTSLLDIKIYTQEQIATLYRRRWQAEVDIRYIKTIMGMEHISSQSPRMVHNQIWAYFLAYNLIRRIMLEVGLIHNVDPLRVSFKGCIDCIFAYASDMFYASLVSLESLTKQFYWGLAKHLNIFRPFHIHPRAIKRRKKDFYYLKEPRWDFQVRVLLQYLIDLQTS